MLLLTRRLGEIDYANNSKQVYNKVLGASTWLFGAVLQAALGYLREKF